MNEPTKQFYENEAFKRYVADYCSYITGKTKLTVNNVSNAVWAGWKYQWLESVRTMVPKERVDDALKYCIGQTDMMWAATIVGRLLGCDFRDAEQKLNEYFDGKDNQ